VEAAEAEQRRATAAAASASSRGALLLGGGALGAIGGVTLLATLGSPLGLMLVVLGVVLAAVGVRTVAARGGFPAAVKHARGQYAAAQHRLTEVRATLAAAAETTEQMQEAESVLRELGHLPPESLADAQQRLAAAQANELEQERAHARERTVAAEVARVNQMHVDAQVRVRSAESMLETAERNLEAARQAAGIGAEADLADLVATAQEDTQRAGENLEIRRQRATGLLDAPTPERLRIEAAGVRSAIEEIERQVSELPVIEQRLVAERERADGLEHTIASERQSLREILPGLEVATSADDVDGVRAALQQRLSSLDQAELRRTQTRLHTEIGGARETAQRQHESAARSWQTAQNLADQSMLATGADSLTRVACEIAHAASRAAAASDAVTAEAERLSSASGTERARLAAIASGLGEPLDLARLRSASSELGTERRQMEQQVARLPTLEEQHARALAALSRTDNELETAWCEVDRRTVALGLDQAGRDTDRLRQRIGDELRVLDEHSTRGRLDGVIAEIAEATETIRQRENRIAEDQREIANRLADVALQASGFECEQLAEQLPELEDEGLPDERVLTEERESLLGDISHLRMAQRELETQLDLSGVPLDLAEQEAALAGLVRTREIKKRATRIITTARTRMIDRVLPGTEQNLRLLLPHLTAERYYDAKLDSEYRLSVWDAAAQRYVAKDIFSGGTRDQFSLALRLAFALATLPQELGTTPGFIFLDEPLSAFDHPRTTALVELLTQGQIAKSFAQIFLISHSRSFDPDLFPYYLRMEEGRVAETNLPNAAGAVMEGVSIAK
jgi:hypothetical protein